MPTQSVSAGEALEMARASLPSGPRTSLRQPEFVGDDELALGIQSDRVGDVVVHFPRVCELREKR
ncbi:hypothetical protein CQ14_09660 [Bradyrhizobium lablabi]|uniref:Uncharacterized protein n=1 Tax=Bradyrhizobium lablabi TaxID=722472 RepID=A0A0R3MYY9_9BRAD|nr:hypothetical protein CQ14_09660 [Bradyrhizobium lablabi]